MRIVRGVLEITGFVLIVWIGLGAMIYWLEGVYRRHFTGGE